MRNLDYFRNKRVVVVGLARSGLSCANLLYDFCAEVSITDKNDTEALRLNVSKLKSVDIKFELGSHSQDLVRGRDFVVVSPGVPRDALPLVWARQFNIPIISEIEVGWILCPAEIIAVTGSNGKTTTTTLIGRMLQAAGKRVFVCGNIGNPFCAELDKMRPGDFVSLEVSSFQLETVKYFKPKIAVILNFSRNHLDRHSDMQEYLAAKKRIFMNQDRTDHLILNGEDSTLMNLASEARADVSLFSRKDNANPDYAAVLAVASLLGINKDTCLKVFSEFKGLEHRLEYVTTINKVTFINDSKATTADSCLMALESIAGPVILIAGGRHKGVDYSIILDVARKKVKEIILVGEAKDNIAAVFKGQIPIDEANSLREAVEKAYLKAGPGESVLLSPMCSSFDMFSDYEERGRVFKKAVYDLQNTKIKYGS